MRNILIIGTIIVIALVIVGCGQSGVVQQVEDEVIIDPTARSTITSVTVSTANGSTVHIYEATHANFPDCCLETFGYCWTTTVDAMTADSVVNVELSAVWWDFRWITGFSGITPDAPGCNILRDDLNGTIICCAWTPGYFNVNSRVRIYVTNHDNVVREDAPSDGGLIQLEGW